MNENKTNINWYPGHMAKTKKEIKEKINLVDLVYEVIDARMPYSSMMEDVEDILKDKPRIIIMTKYDLCDKTETDKWIDYYKSLGHVVIAVDLKNGKNVNEILKSSEKVLNEMNQKREAKGMKKRSMRVLIIGVPNVGKSTLINKLVGKKATNVGNKPGVTKVLSWIRINKDIELLDTPGLLWPKFSSNKQALILSALSSIKEEILDIEELAIFILNIMDKLYKDHLTERYGNINIDDIEETLDTIGKKRGALIKGGNIDYDKVYSYIIRDLKEGYLGEITLDRIEDVK